MTSNRSSMPDPRVEFVPEGEAEYEGFFAVVRCTLCDFDHHIEGDVSTGQIIQCEGCSKWLEIVGR